MAGVNIYKIPALKGASRRQVLRSTEKMVGDGLIRWIDREKGLIEITELGCIIEETKRGYAKN